SVRWPRRYSWCVVLAVVNIGRMMTGKAVTGGLLRPRWRRGTGRRGILAAVAEYTAGREAAGCGYSAGNGLQVAVFVDRVQIRGRQQTLGIAVSWLREYLFDRTFLHQAAAVHDQHPFAGGGDD